MRVQCASGRFIFWSFVSTSFNVSFSAGLLPAQECSRYVDGTKMNMVSVYQFAPLPTLDVNIAFLRTY